MNGVLHLQDFSQIELLKALMDLQKDMVVMLLSMLEGRRIITSILILPNVNILISVCFTFCWIVCWIHKQNCASHQLWTRIGIYMKRNSPLHQPKNHLCTNQNPKSAPKAVVSMSPTVSLSTSSQITFICIVLFQSSFTVLNRKVRE